MKKHQGDILEKAVRNSGYSVTHVAEKLGYSRRQLYNLFKKALVHESIFHNTGKIIGYDFSTEISFLQAVPRKHKANNTSIEQDCEYWKNKYLSLLEEYNQLLKKTLR